MHKSAEENIIKSLEDRGVETRKVQRFDYAAQDPDWPDVVVTAGKLDHPKTGHPNTGNIGKPICCVPFSNGHTI